MNLHAIMENRPEKIEVKNKIQKWFALNWRTALFLITLFTITWIVIVVTAVISQWGLG